MKKAARLVGDHMQNLCKCSYGLVKKRDLEELPFADFLAFKTGDRLGTSKNIIKNAYNDIERWLTEINVKKG